MTVTNVRRTVVQQRTLEECLEGSPQIEAVTQRTASGSREMSKDHLDKIRGEARFRLVLEEWWVKSIWIRSGELDTPKPGANRSAFGRPVRRTIRRGLSWTGVSLSWDAAGGVSWEAA
jgi:hypothetical protein